MAREESGRAPSLRTYQRPSTSEALRSCKVGCDPKRDSTRILAGGHLIPAVLEIYRDKLRHGQDAHAISLDDIVFKTPSGIYCVEAGGPEPGIGCAGRGVLTALQILKDLKAFETFEIDVAIYDVLGDVVCGGFAMPIREGFASEIYLVCSGGFMSIYAANNIARAVQRLARGATPGWQGLSATVTAMTRWSGRWSLRLPSVWAATFVEFVPRSSVIQACEVEGRAVVEHAPQSEEATIFRELALKVTENDTKVIPSPVEELPELEELYRENVLKKKT